jgi:hypothetical protein
VAGFIGRERRVLAAGGLLASSCALLTNVNGLGGDGGLEDVTLDNATIDGAPESEAAPPPLYLPEAGLYFYDPKPNANDTVLLSLNDASINLPFDARLPCVVTVDGGSWTWQLTENNSHTTTYFFDTQPGTLTSATTTEVVIANTAIVTCNPTAVFIWIPLDSGTLSHSCQGKNSLVDGGFGSSGPYAYLGEDLITSADAAPIANGYHFTETRTVTGTQTGSQSIEWWLDTTTGLPLRLIVDTQILSPSPYGPATFTEHADYAIESVFPAAFDASTD